MQFPSDRKYLNLLLHFSTDNGKSNSFFNRNEVIQCCTLVSNRFRCKCAADRVKLNSCHDVISTFLLNEQDSQNSS